MAVIPAFRGRARECEALVGVLDRVRRGDSEVLVLRGEAGIGKTSLLRYAAGEATGFRVVELAGVESEADVPFAALQQLCSPMLAGVPDLPAPQAHALRVAFGLAEGRAPDRLLVGLAVLGLLAGAAAERPLVCLIDDGQWLDGVSADVLAFVGRRLFAESVALLFAVRETPGRDFAGLPTLSVEGLTDDDARGLLTAAVPGHLDAQVRDRIVAETHGNPLGLLELAGATSDAELAGGFAVPAAGAVPRLHALYARRVNALPRPTRQLVLLAAADPTGDATLLWRAAQTLGLGRDAAAAADAGDLLQIDARVRFRHPIVRSAAYAAGRPEDRSAVHRALAAATDPRTDPERRVWHLAAAATGPDEDVAAQLERTADRVRSRAGLAAAAAFLQRSVTLTPEAGRRADRALAGATAHLQAGAFDAALSLLARADAAAVDDLQRARVEQVRAQVGRASTWGREAPLRLVRAAAGLESLDLRLARDTYLDAIFASVAAGALAQPGGHLSEICRAVPRVPRPPGGPRVADLLLDGLSCLVLEGRAAGQDRLRAVVDAFLDDQVAAVERLQWGFLASGAALALWDFPRWAVLTSRHLEFARAYGALAPLSAALNGARVVATFAGDFASARALGAEEVVVKEVTGARKGSYGALLLAAYQGRPSEALPLVTASAQDARARGEGLGLHHASWATAVLHNGLGRYAEALPAARTASAEADSPFVSGCALPELVEAAARTGDAALAADALHRLSAATAVAGSDWAHGLEARCRALLAEGPRAEDHYLEAVERLGRTPLRPELARAHLLYGEWLRRASRRLDARRQLRTAHDLFEAMGAEGFAERARRELVATGERMHRREPAAPNPLTPQEDHIARLAREGRTNPEIGAELFLSTRTVEWHLRKIFQKLGITSRRELHDAMPPRQRRAPDDGVRGR